MPSETVRCAIVGSGLAALATYATLRHGGVRPRRSSSTARTRTRPRSGERGPRRSASSGCAPSRTAISPRRRFPGLRCASRSGAVAGPLVASARAAITRASTISWRTRGCARRVAGSGASACSESSGSARSTAASSSTVTDRSPRARRDGPPRPRATEEYPGAVHAYEPHEYAPRVAIVGAGMAAATEWLNALAAGSEVVSIRRREPLRRPLNVPRALFSKRGLAAFHASAPTPRGDAARPLGAVLSSRPAWDEPLEAPGARRSSASRTQTGRPTGRAGDLRDRVPQGLARGHAASDLVEAHDLVTHGRWIALSARLDRPRPYRRPTRTLSLAGVAGQWAFPAADTIAGAKYAAHGS